MSKKAQSDSHGGENRGYRRNANQLHEEIGHNRAGNAEQIVHPAVCRVVERRIARRPGDQRRRQPPQAARVAIPMAPRRVAARNRETGRGGDREFGCASCFLSSPLSLLVEAGAFARKGACSGDNDRA